MKIAAAKRISPIDLKLSLLMIRVEVMKGCGVMRIDALSEGPNGTGQLGRKACFIGAPGARRGEEL